MIYTYHSVKFRIKDNITITPIRFFIDMLRLIGKKVVSLNEYNPKDKNNVVLTFDDGYKDFLKYAYPILKFFNYPFELCICADFVGKSDWYLNLDDLKRLLKNKNCRLEYHSKTHADLTTLNSDDEIIKEIHCPDYLKELDENSFKYFVYPNWNYNPNVERLVKNEGYKKGLSGKNNTASENTWLRIRKG